MKINMPLLGAVAATLTVAGTAGAQVTHVEHHDAVVRHETVTHDHPVVVHRTVIRPAYHRHCTTRWYNHHRVTRCW